MANRMQEPKIMGSAKSQPETLQDDLYDPVHCHLTLCELVHTKLCQLPTKRVKSEVPCTTESSNIAIKQQVIIPNSKAHASKSTGKQCAVDLTPILESSANCIQLNADDLKYEPAVMAMDCQALVIEQGLSKGINGTMKGHFNLGSNIVNQVDLLFNLELTNMMCKILAAFDKYSKDGPAAQAHITDNSYSCGIQNSSIQQCRATYDHAQEIKTTCEVEDVITDA
ncbi:uncharacterized protein SPSC_01820 [Sporisorium scitamineum]|uniref:Uncharacterized protein n=1 Tax=Sporisorium scitamineum TaxID=49012 RepID=A0A127ZAM3_9BASI|nr:uncharacterized protein SPSC_01820 [Sporisorium scitamineum]